jgi:hypothetical protein
MSEGFAAPSPISGPGTRVRPPTVTVANLLLFVVAAVYVVGFIMALSIIGTVSEVVEEEFAGTEAEGFEGYAVGGIIGVSAVNLLIAIGLVVLAILNNRGKNPARIVTWVLGGIALCCNGFGLIGSGLGGGSSFGGSTSDGVDQEQLQRRIEDALPSWYNAVSITTLVISVLALAGALLLLALPPSNEFFRKPQQPFEPPAPNYPQVG